MSSPPGTHVACCGRGNEFVASIPVMDNQSTRVPVSIIVPIRNEAENLPRCLASIAWADEIFVVDSQSTDESQSVAEKLGARVVQFEFNGTWPKKKNWALENLPFRNEWVFILDADEVLPAEAEAEFRAAIAGAGATAGFWINRRFMFMGRWLRHAYYPNWNLRLFRHSLGRYEKLTDAATASGDNEVHEHVVVQGPTGRLRCEIDHYAFPSVEVFVEKHNRYSNWEARVAIAGQSAQSSGEFQSTASRAATETEAVRAAVAVSSASCVSFTSTSGRRDFSTGAKVTISRGCTASTSFSPSRRPTN